MRFVAELTRRGALILGLAVLAAAGRRSLAQDVHGAGDAASLSPEEIEIDALLDEEQQPLLSEVGNVLWLDGR